MKTTRTAVVLVGALALGWLAPGCSKPREKISERDRKEAAMLASEAQFAINLREWARAEGLLARTVKLAPNADTWVALGSSRVRLGNKAGAREAYQQALRAFEDEAAVDEKRVEPWLGQITVLALLGKTDASRALVAKVAKRFPNDSRVKNLADPKQFEAMLADPGFRENAL
ncbi:MAG: tetratricopeptide repeat protein [Opitutaceae bacterium]|nr:tetratricopeptide repeat protein [Opitutaceae bacterium]